MRITYFEWDDRNTSHIARHDVSIDEVEEACDNTPLILKGRGGLHLVYSQTDAGRYLLTIIRYKGRGIVQIITARDMTERERKLCKERRK